jgi:pimeloyl-ACP methyl ester carboxylesterase
MAPFFEPWQTFFTVVQWDQPHAGVTRAANKQCNDDVLSLARLERDGVSVAEFITGYLKVPQVILLAISGGTMPGLAMLKRCPQRFSAYVALGQIVNWVDQDVSGYQAVLQLAHARGDAAAVAELTALGAPPYADAKSDARKTAYTAATTLIEQQALSAVDPSVFAAMRSPPGGVKYVPAGVAVEDTQATSMQA